MVGGGGCWRYTYFIGMSIFYWSAHYVEWWPGWWFNQALFSSRTRLVMTRSSLDIETQVDTAWPSGQTQTGTENERYHCHYSRWAERKEWSECLRPVVFLKLKTLLPPLGFSKGDVIKLPASFARWRLRFQSWGLLQVQKEAKHRNQLLNVGFSLFFVSFVLGFIFSFVRWHWCSKRVKERKKKWGQSHLCKELHPVPH